MKQKLNKNNKKIVVYTAGTWDLFHIGHLNIFKNSKALGTKLIVGVSTDELVINYKKAPPIISYEDRLNVVKSCKYVDEVVKQEKLLEINQLKKINPDIIVIGDDWKNKYLEGLEWAKKQPNIKVIYLPYTQNVSSTFIKTKIKNGWQEDRNLDETFQSIPNSLKGKNILITGSSSGIGLEIAKKFAEKEANIGIHYSKNKQEAQKIVDELSKITKVKVYCQDFLKDPIDLIQRFVNDFGGIDILINNAGMLDSKSFLDMTSKDYDKIFNVNSKAPFLLSRDAFKIMKKNKFGRIINISSISVKFGRGRNNSIQYAATKSTLDVLTKGLSIMGAEHNILVNSIRPGIIMTRIHHGRKNLSERIQLIPLKRAGTVEDIANLVIYLTSEKGSFITGQVFDVSGGE